MKSVNSVFFNPSYLVLLAPAIIVYKRTRNRSDRIFGKSSIRKERFLWQLKRKKTQKKEQ